MVLVENRGLHIKSYQKLEFDSKGVNFLIDFDILPLVTNLKSK